jgi:fluoride ion exporter CrcB/FEX
MSTFAVQSDLLVKDGHIGAAAIYVVATVAAGLPACWFGIAASRFIVKAR